MSRTGRPRRHSASSVSESAATGGAGWPTRTPGRTAHAGARRPSMATAEPATRTTMALTSETPGASTATARAARTAFRATSRLPIGLPPCDPKQPHAAGAHATCSPENAREHGEQRERHGGGEALRGRPEQSDTDGGLEHGHAEQQGGRRWPEPLAPPARHRMLAAAATSRSPPPGRRPPAPLARRMGARRRSPPRRI